MLKSYGTVFGHTRRSPDIGRQSRPDPRQFQSSAEKYSKISSSPKPLCLICAWLKLTHRLRSELELPTAARRKIADLLVQTEKCQSCTAVNCMAYGEFKDLRTFGLLAGWQYIGTNRFSRGPGLYQPADSGKPVLWSGERIRIDTPCGCIWLRSLHRTKSFRVSRLEGHRWALNIFCNFIWYFGPFIIKTDW